MKKTKILVCIPTYNRSYYLEQLLEQINSLPYNEHDIEILVIDDGSNKLYSDRNKSFCDLFANVTYIEKQKNLGKKGYWKIADEIMSFVEVYTKQDYYFYLPDDFTLCENFFNRSITLWENIQDKDKICLSLFTDKERMQTANWVDKIPDLIQFNEHHYYRSQWMDMCIISTRKFYEALDFTIKKVNPKRWADFDAIGSGVGPQITKRLNKDYSLYHVANSLCFEEEHESRMNPGRTQSYTIQCSRKDYTQKVHVGIASIPSRKAMLQRTIESLIYQVDYIHVYLNGYKEVPGYLNNPKILAYKDQFLGNIGDLGKLYFLTLEEVSTGYAFLCDDDIIYPGDYVYNMINHIENNNRKAVIGLHGIILKDKVKNYYKDRTVSSCLKTNTVNKFCHLLGTGAIAFHGSTVKYLFDSFGINDKEKNMADIHFGIAAQRCKIPLLCVSHAGDWLKYMEPETTIFDTAKNDCSIQTKLVNRVKWKIHTIEEKYNGVSIYKKRIFEKV